MDSSFLDENLNIYDWIGYTEKLKTWLKQNRLDDNEDDVRKFVEDLWRGLEVGVSFEKLSGLSIKPDWLDLEKIKVGQRFAEDFYLPICTSEVVALLLVLSHDGVLRKLISTGKSSDPYTSFKRYLSTGRRVRSWMIGDLFDRASEASKNIDTVNAMHRSFYNSALTADKNDFLRRTELRVVESPACPFICKDMSNIVTTIDANDVPQDHFPISQTAMAGTQFSFAGLLLLSPEKFGICPVKYRKELECFIHLWRYIAYRLGTLDQFNLCVGTFEEVTMKSKLFMDFVIKPNLKLLTPRWEHMTRCIIEGMHFTVQGFSFEAHLLFAMDVIDLPCPNLYSKSSLATIAQYKMMKFVNYYVMPINWMRSFITKQVLQKIDSVASNVPTEEQFYSQDAAFRKGYNRVSKIPPPHSKEHEEIGQECNLEEKVTKYSSAEQGETQGQDITVKMTAAYSIGRTSVGKDI